MAGSDSGETLETCRDFKNGDCRRGSRCKFNHPKLEVCHDFQTRGCNRPNCKYAHLSKDDAKLYEESGKYPSSHANNGLDTLQKGLLLDNFYGKRLRTDSLDLLTGLTPMAKKPFSPVATGDAVSDVCRDFDREDCRRGSRCKYFHPKLKICRDYQKDKCERETCRFLHMTREEENTYESSGKIPANITKEDIKKNRLNPVSSSVNKGAVVSPLYGFMPSDGILGGNEMGSEICRDFEKGNCSRGYRCKYAHTKLNVCRDFQAEKCKRDNCKFLHLTREEETEYEMSGKAPEHIDQGKLQRNKITVSNRNNSDGARGYGSSRNFATTASAGILGGIGNIHPALDVRNFHTSGGLTSVENMIGLPERDPELVAVLQENDVMSKKIQELQQQVDDLRKMNDTLYEQNMMYRNQHKGI